MTDYLILAIALFMAAVAIVGTVAIYSNFLMTLFGGIR